MLVLQATDQARELREYLKQFAELSLPQLTDQLRAIETTFIFLSLRAEAPLPLLLMPDREAFYRVTRVAANRLGALQRIPTFQDPDRLSPHVRQKVLNLNTHHSVVIDLSDIVLSLFSEIHGRDYIGRLQTRRSSRFVSSFVYRYLDSLSDMTEAISQLSQQYLALDSFVEAWEAFIVPNQLEPDTHSLALRFSSETLTLRQCCAWLGLLDALVTIEAASINQHDLADRITLARLETGSIVHELKDIPREFLDKVGLAIKRIMNPQEIYLTNLEKEIDIGTKTAIARIDIAERAADALSKIREDVRAGKLSKGEAAALRRKIMAGCELPIGSGPVVVEVDGKTVPPIDEAERPQLPPGHPRSQ